MCGTLAQALLLLGARGAKPEEVAAKALESGLVPTCQPGWEDEASIKARMRTCLTSESYGIWHRVERNTWAHTAWPSVR